MTGRRALFDAAIDAARDWHGALPEMAAFCDWPDDLSWRELAARRLPVADLIAADPGACSAASERMRDALVAIAPHVEWRQSYSEAQVGRRFLDSYGWFELAGPKGHFETRKCRVTVGYWSPDVHYPDHCHEPEELYTVVSGRATFHSEGDPDEELGPGGVRFHASRQLHAMTMTDSPILTLVLWRGGGLADPPQMPGEAA